MHNLSDQEKFAVAAILDDYVYILLDLYFGKFINLEDSIDINDHMRVEYRQEIQKDIIENGKRNFQSNFFVKVYYNNQIILDFICANRSFKVLTIDAFLANMTLNELDKFRKYKFTLE